MTEGEVCLDPMQHAAGLAEKVDNLTDRLGAHETLIVALAKRRVEKRFRDVVAILSKTPGLLAAHENWPFAAPMEKVGFLEQLSWAKYETEFTYWADGFQRTVEDVCRHSTSGEFWEDDITLDLFLTACRVETEAYSIDAVHEWAADHLTVFAWSELLDGDIDFVEDLGLGKPEDEQYAFLVTCQDAIISWAEQEFVSLARRAVLALQKMHSVGIFASHGTFRSVWDEYSYMVQDSEELPWWSETVEAHCIGLVEQADSQKLRLLLVAALDFAGVQHESSKLPLNAMPLIGSVVADKVRIMARNRNITRLKWSS